MSNCPTTVDVANCPGIEVIIIPCEPREIVIEIQSLTIEIESLCQALSVYEINEYFQSITISSAGQNSFTLDYAPSSPTKSKLFLNGQKLSYGTDYNISGNLIHWGSSQVLETTDQVEIYFY